MLHLPFEKIVLATGNAGKVDEFMQLADDSLGAALIAQSEFGIDSPPETGLTFIENALLKARHAAKETGLPAIADDSGLVVAALNGAPGLYSARYAGENATREQRLQKLLTELAHVPAAQREAYFYCVLVFIERWDDPLPVISEGIWHGQILAEIKGMYGFGFEPIFYVPSHCCSAGEIPVQEKIRISHRGQSWQKLCQILQQRYAS